MFDGVINHTYGAIFSGLDDQNRIANTMREAVEHINAAYSNMFGSGAYDGEAAGTLQTVQQQSSQRMNEHIDGLTTLHQRADQQQCETQALDNQCANNLL